MRIPPMIRPCLHFFHVIPFSGWVKNTKHHWLSLALQLHLKDQQLSTCSWFYFDCYSHTPQRRIILDPPLIPFSGFRLSTLSLQLVLPNQQQLLFVASTHITDTELSRYLLYSYVLCSASELVYKPVKVTSSAETDGWTWACPWAPNYLLSLNY